MRFFAVVIIGLVIFFPLERAAAAGIGFAASNGVSFSAEPVFANKMVKVYAVVVNNVYTKVTATVAFYDSGTEFNRVVVEIPLEEARQVSVPWLPVSGQHTIGAKFVAALATNADGSTKQLTADELSAIGSPVSNSLFVDADSDGDGIGDHDEIATYHTAPLNKDSDGDGLSDYDEIFKYKTDPNNVNTDGDGMTDGDEVRAGRNPLVKDDPAPPPPPLASAPTVVTPPPQPAQQPQEKKVVAENKIQPLTINSVEKKSAGANTTAAQQKKNSVVEVEASVSASSTMATSSPATFATSTQSEIKIAPPAPDIAEENNWVKVLGIIAGLFAVAAVVSGALAWREQNKY